MPVWVLTRVNQLIWPFLWGSRIETVSRKSCCLSLKNGSLNVCDLRFKCEATLLSIGSSPPLLPREWSLILGPGFSLCDHWSLVRDDFTQNFKNDLPWLITLRGVKTRDALTNWGYINSAVCASCPTRETIDHVFIFCARSQLVWRHFEPILHNVLGSVFFFDVPFIFFFRWPA